MRKIYLIILTFLTLLYTRAQEKPGGTNLEVELWLKANAVSPNLPADNDDVIFWQDMSGKGHDFGPGNNFVPSYVKNSMNYNPSVNIYNDEDATSTENRRRKLQTLNDFPIDLGKSYYFFWVSSANIDGSSTNSIVLSLNSPTAATSTVLGWNSTVGKIFHRTRGTRYIYNNDLDKTYGIAVAILPNTTSTPQEQYFNGKKNSGSITGRIMNGRSTKAVIGSLKDDTSITDYFEGEIQEIIVLSANVGSSIAPIELQKVQSYLAIKYGIALDPTQQPNYINSAQNEFWTGTQNNGYQNDIFGIGRDDASGLYQKQSTNFGKRTMTVFVGDFKETNHENTGIIANNTFLTFGSNKEDNSRDYIHPAGTNFQNGSLALDINEINNVVLKAQTFGDQNFTVNIKPHISADYVLVSSNPNFLPSQTRIYLNDEESITQNVLINDRDYIAFAFHAIAPGGVSKGIKLWLRADDLNSIRLVQGTANNVDAWRDQTPNKNNYSFDAVKGVTNKKRPTFIACDPRVNYNPTIDFGYDDYLAITQGPMADDAPNDFTSFVVYHATNYAAVNRLYTHGFGSTDPRDDKHNRRPSMGFAPGEGVGRIRNSGGSPGQTNVDGTKSGFNKGTTALQMINTHKANGVRGNGYAIHDFGGWQEKVTATGLFGDGFKMASGSTLGGASLATSTFQGLIAEVFFYERALTAEEQDRVRSYLGMKYGITLDVDASNTSPGNNYDYILSDGVTTVWKGNTSNAAYHNNVAGVVRDDDADIHINKSRSTAASSIVTMLTPGTELCSVESNTLSENLAAIFWGSNGMPWNGSIDYSTTPGICGELDQRLQRIWKAQKTTIGQQTMTIRAGGPAFLYDGPGWKVSLLVAKNAEDFANNNWALTIPGELKNGQHEFNYTFTDEYTFFTFGAEKEPAVCETCEFNGTKRIEFINHKTWNKGQRLQTFNLGDNFTAKVEVIDPDGVVRPKYPKGSSRKSLRGLRKGKKASNTNPVTTKITFSKAAAASFEIFEIDRHARKFNQVEIYGMCGGHKVFPKLTYITNENKSTYTIDPITQNVANAKNKSSGYLHKKGRMHVEFDKAVEEIYIVNKIDFTSSSGGYKRLGIGAMDLYCPTPLPPPTDDGLIFTKEASSQVLLCEEVNYTFRITNISCEDKTVNFKDVLPAGLKWVTESLSINDALAQNAQINDYSSTATMSIDNLVIAGSTTVTLRAQAVFDLDATAKVYANRAELHYTLNGGLETLASCDRFSKGCEASKTIALPTVRPTPISSSILMNSACYSAQDELTITLNFNNPNALTFQELFLDASFDDNFTYILNSISSPTLNLGGSVSISVDEGQIEIEGLQLPTGSHTITFKVKVPDESELLIDPETLLPVPFSLVYDLSSETEDSCQDVATLNATGEIELPFCTTCTELPNTSAPTEFTPIGISSLKDQIEGWPANVTNGFVAIESSKKGFVMTRTAAAAIKNPTQGMIIYDTEDKCIKLYNGTLWNCIKRTCNK